MTVQPLLSPEAVRDRLTRSYRSRHREWLGGNGTWPLVVALGAPTEADAQQHGELIRTWIAFAPGLPPGRIGRAMGNSYPLNAAGER